MTDIVGIDLGTTNSEIALYCDHRPVVLADEQGRIILPSVVGLSETGDLLVGEEARNQFMLYPERTVRSIKRQMGSDARYFVAWTRHGCRRMGGDPHWTVHSPREPLCLAVQVPC